MNRRLLCGALGALLALLAVLLLPPTVQAQDSGELLLVEISFSSQAGANRMAGWLDVWAFFCRLRPGFMSLTRSATEVCADSSGVSAIAARMGFRST